MQRKQERAFCTVLSPAFDLWKKIPAVNTIKLLNKEQKNGKIQNFLNFPPSIV